MTHFLKVFVFIFVLSVISCKKEKEDKSKVTKKEIHTIDFIKSPTSDNSEQPFLFSNGNKLLMSWTQKVNDSVYALIFSELKEGEWTPSIEINNGDNWFINWADFPAIAENNGNIATHFLQKSDPATFAYDVRVQLSNNDGKNWNKDFVLHTDGTKTEHGFATLIPYKEDSFFITWLDGRNTGGGHTGAMNIRAATILKTGTVIDDTLIDSKTCDCCQTSAAITSNGPVIVYRDRSDAEVRDIYISRLLNGNWTNPKAIYNDNWLIKGCPVNGPKAASFKNTLAVAWFTEANDVSKVIVSFSNDNGENFDTPIQIGNEKVIGRVDVALLDEQNALVSWMESTEEGAAIKVVKVNKDGTKQNSLVIVSLAVSRGSGFPQLEVVNDTVYFAWNDRNDAKRSIKLASVSLRAFD